VKQVLSARSGRIHVPLSEEGKTGLRGYPLWIQDILMGYVGKSKKNKFIFGKDNEPTMLK
jgi:hypothetical protein